MWNLKILIEDVAADLVSGCVSLCRTGLDKPWGFHKAEAPRFQDSRHMKVVRLSALHTDRLYLQEITWYSFLLEAESNPGP